MERKAFLRGIGLAGAASMIPFGKILAGDTGNEDKPTACTLIPSETKGPFPLDLEATSYYFRTDIREDRTGAPFNLKMKILGKDNCSPMSNVRVNVWMCDKDGVYSGYETPQNPGGTADTKWLRGWQMTDANGEVNFVTIFPGWYSGRICHIHFQVYVSSTYAAVSQMTFDIAAKNAIYAAYPALYTKGADPTSLAADNIFSDGYAYQLATITPNGSGGYDGYLEVTVQGSGTTAIGHIEKENARRFNLGQNYPNPYRGSTTVPFNLLERAGVTLDIFDLSGRKVYSTGRRNLAAGDHSITVDFNGPGLTEGNYIYQMQVETKDGLFRTCKMMTAAQ